MTLPPLTLYPAIDLKDGACVRLRRPVQRLLDADDHRVGSDEGLDVRLPEARLAQPALAVGPGELELRSMGM